MFQGENALKYRVLRLEPTDCSGKAARFNPLAEVRMGSLHAIAGITSAEKQKAAQQLYEGK